MKFGKTAKKLGIFGVLIGTQVFAGNNRTDELKTKPLTTLSTMRAADIDPTKAGMAAAKAEIEQALSKSGNLINYFRYECVLGQNRILPAAINKYKELFKQEETDISAENLKQVEARFVKIAENADLLGLTIKNKYTPIPDRIINASKHQNQKQENNEQSPKDAAAITKANAIIWAMAEADKEEEDTLVNMETDAADQQLIVRIQNKEVRLLLKTKADKVNKDAIIEPQGDKLKNLMSGALQQYVLVDVKKIKQH